MNCLYICQQWLPESECLRLLDLISEDDGLLLIDDATYLAQSPIFNSIQHRYVLKTDLLMRGIDQMNQDFELVDGYSEMVTLTLTFDKSLTWSL